MSIRGFHAPVLEIGMRMIELIETEWFSHYIVDESLNEQKEKRSPVMINGAPVLTMWTNENWKLIPASWEVSP
jgi:hypothetical protein